MTQRVGRLSWRARWKAAHKNVAFHCNMSDHSDKSADTEKTNLTHLPLDVLRLVFEFCEGSNSLTATNRYFYNVRRHLYLRLSRKYSLEYYKDENFRTGCSALLKPVWFQYTPSCSCCGWSSACSTSLPCQVVHCHLTRIAQPVAGWPTHEPKTDWFCVLRGDFNSRGVHG